MDDLLRRWITMSKQDYEVAKHLYENFYPKPLETICYHSQQSAEKAIKTVILSLGAEGGLPRKHDLTFLLNQIKNQVDIDDSVLSAADRLNAYSVNVRYPDEMFLEKEDAENALKYAEEILAWAEKHIDNI